MGEERSGMVFALTPSRAFQCQASRCVVRLCRQCLLGVQGMAPAHQSHSWAANYWQGPFVQEA